MLGEYEQALVRADRILVNCREYFFKAWALALKGKCLGYLGRHQEAETLYRDALQQNFSPSLPIEESPWPHVMRSCLAHALEMSGDAGRLEEAEQLCRGCPAALEEHFGESYTWTLDSLEVRSAICAKLPGRMEEAASLREEYRRRVDGMLSAETAYGLSVATYLCPSPLTVLSGLGSLLPSSTFMDEVLPGLLPAF
jgi:tetratricopeptide (TPR) repeat protein